MDAAFGNTKSVSYIIALTILM